jgi:16S rRNA (guanine527-N7)-methyltransferase
MDLISAVDARLNAADLAFPHDVVRDCARYLALLTRWNRRMNLTALPLPDPPPDASIDKLIVEPLVGFALVETGDEDWIDLGSGGGSPAIPLRIAHRAGTLRMVESRSRKCAFLRETVRTLALPDTHVLEGRYEALPQNQDVDLVTIRAVRLDEPVTRLIRGLLRPGGRLFAFGGWAAELEQQTSRALPDGSELRVLRAH